jgi:tripartite-type tricarboxylate transporter receptor subunit TctC
VPTFDEAGLRGFTSDTWNAIVAPPRTPPALAAKISAAINDVLHSRDVAVHLKKLAMNPVGGTPAEVLAFIKEETRRWNEVIRSAGIKPN